MRNYHAQQQHQHHHQQQQHQQQPPAFNNPPQSAMKHNGPHTPPTPQSPVMHQQTGGPLHGMDYNQMHLQQQQQQSQLVLSVTNFNLLLRLLIFFYTTKQLLLVPSRLFLPITCTNLAGFFVLREIEA